MRTVRDHEAEVNRLASEAKESLFVVSPFVTGVAKDIFNAARKTQRRLLTRLNPQDLAAGASDAAVLRDLFLDGVQVKTLRGLHAKVYMADGAEAIVTSANLTTHGLSLDSYEYGIHVTRSECPQLFDEMEALWSGQQVSLTAGKIEAAARAAKEFKAKQPKSSEKAPADESEPQRHDGTDGLRIRTTGVVPDDIVRQFEAGAATDSRFGAGQDFQNILDELVRSHRQAISIRSFLWLVGWCNTGGAFEKTSKDIAQPLAMVLFGYVPPQYLEDGHDLKAERYRPSLGRELEDRIVAFHEQRLPRQED